MLARQRQLTFAPLHHRLRRLKRPTSRGDQCTKKEGYRHSHAGQAAASLSVPVQQASGQPPHLKPRLHLHVGTDDAHSSPRCANPGS